MQMPDVHVRMLFTLHAMAEEAGGGAQWRVLTTSYDRKIVSWLLQLDQQPLAARLWPDVTWHGTGSQISAMCSVPVRPPPAASLLSRPVSFLFCLPLLPTCFLAIWAISVHQHQRWSWISLRNVVQPCTVTLPVQCADQCVPDDV